MRSKLMQCLLIPVAALALSACDQGSSSTPPAAAPHTEAAEEHAATVETKEAEVKETAAAATEAATENASALEANAQKLLDEATQYIKDNKLDLADKALTQLEGMNLSEAWASKITDARKMLDAKKSMDAAGDAADKLKGALGQ